MINPRWCPLCKLPATKQCRHLALAAPGWCFVERCVELCEGQKQWQALCRHRRAHHRRDAEWSSEREDFKWLETAFCDQFLRGLRSFEGLDHEWRSGAEFGQGTFWVLLWSKEPEKLWWELREEFERQTAFMPAPQDSPPWLIWLHPSDGSAVRDSRHNG